MALTALLSAALLATVASSEESCSPEGAGRWHGTASGAALLQKQSKVERGGALGGARVEWHSSCGQRLSRGSARPAACVVIRDGKAMLVKVPYGSRPGWDLPGGYNKGGDEPACATAEREVCEETGYAVEAVAQISSNVFRCQVKRSGACTKSVDEGFLRTEWFGLQDLDRIGFRGGTWGDKKGLIRQELSTGQAPPAPAPAPPGAQVLDACGCRPGSEGFSSRAQACSPSSRTSPWEAAHCQRTGRSPPGNFDVCGCMVGAQGWSSTRGRCSSRSQTSQDEAAECRRRL